ncbi:MAG: DUF1566 domain-containing protein, partial [Ketobacter sp.]|nr:DUF1566 domain-containing protein [Ketobacter sp.]
MYVNFKIKVSYLIVGVVLLGSLMLGGIALAGEPDSTGEPSATSSYSLEDLYQRLNAGTVGTSSVFTEPTTGPGEGTMHSINEIMAAAPALDNTDGATTTQVLAGQTFWGLTASQWATQTGTMIDNGAGDIITPTTTSQTVAAGYWSSANTVQGDSNLAAVNIVSGTAIFGVDGSAVTASGNATDAQVLTGITYSNDSGASTGTMVNNGAVTITPTATNVAIAAGYHNGSGYVISDTDLISGNIKSGVTLFGVDGTLSSGSTYNAAVGKTGQTACYDTSSTPLGSCGDASFPGQDGDHKKGVSVSPRFTDNSDGTVTDNLTGLIWLKEANCSTITMNWTRALTEVQELNTAGTMNGNNCGDTSDESSHQTDWRLPNVKEYQSLIDFGQ